MASFKYGLFGVGVIILLCVVSAWAAGVCVVDGPYHLGPGYEKHVVTCTADSSDGSYPATTITMTPGYVTRLSTNPTVTLTDNYDVTLTDADGIDVLGGAGANRDTSTPEDAQPTQPKQNDGTLTLNITNNSVNSAELKLKIYSVR